MNTTKIVRSLRNKENPYTMISNSIANLPATEAGIMLQILSNSDNWVVNKEVVRKRSGLGKERFNKAWRHLKELGYILIKRRPIQNGKFFYHYTIIENPQAQNPSLEDDKPYTENRTTATHITETRATNNNQVIMENQETIFSSGSDGLSTKVDVRPGNNNTGSYVLGQDIKDEGDIQTVPTPSLCCGEIRDTSDNKNPEQTPISSQPTSNSNGDIDSTSIIKTENQLNSFSTESWYPASEGLSTDLKEIIEDRENIQDDLLIDMIQGFYKEALPQWEAQLKQQQLRDFFEELSRIRELDPFEIELVTEYYNRIRRESSIQPFTQ